MALRSFGAVVTRTLRAGAAAVRPAARFASSGAAEIPIAPQAYAYHRLEERLPTKTAITKDELFNAFRTMVVMRRVEMQAEDLYRNKMIRGFLHVYTGQEAVIVGVESQLRAVDSVITAYRDHCHYLSRGGTIRGCLGELMGKHDGCAKGKGGSMHMYHKPGNFYGGNGIVGAQVPVGAGIALAHQYKGDGGVCWAYYGDGAANQGQVFEAYNMAQLWKLPIVFVCENNHYGMGTSTKRAAANQEFFTRGDQMPGLKVDGMNLLAVREAARFANAFVRERGPLLVEFDTYRYSGHSMSDPGTSYRSREEVQTYRRTRDCIEYVRGLLVEQGWATAEETKAVERTVREEVEAVTEQLKSAPLPPAEELYKDIYAP